MVDWVSLLLIAGVTAVVLYVATRLVTKEEMLDAAYAVRLFATGFLIVVLAWALQPLGLGTLSILVIFLAAVVVIRYVIVEAVGLGDEWVESLLIALLTVIFLFVLDLVLDVLGIGIRFLFLAVG